MMNKVLVVLSIMLGLGNLTPAQFPDNWTVNPSNFEHVMTVTGILKVNNQIANQSGNVIAAFAGSECRGRAIPVLTNGQQMYFLMIYSNSNAEIITFKSYYSPLDTVLTNTNSLAFDRTLFYGSPDNPYEFKASYTIVGIEYEDKIMHPGFQLFPNYPNPFNASTTFEYEINNPGWVTLSIVDINGHLVQNIVDIKQESGNYKVSWTAPVISSGVYFYTLQVDGSLQKRACVFVK